MSKSRINYTKNNLAVNFDSTDPEDPNVTGLTYSWSFGDGQASTLKNPSHNYSQAGTYPVSLTVTDSYGASNIVAIEINVSNNQLNKEVCNYGETDLTFNFDGIGPFVLNKRVGLSCECKKLYPQELISNSLTITSTDLYTPYYSYPVPSDQWKMHYEPVAPYVTDDYTLDRNGIFYSGDNFMYSFASTTTNLDYYPEYIVIINKVYWRSQGSAFSICQNNTYK